MTAGLNWRNMTNIDLTIPKFLKRKKGYVPKWEPQEMPNTSLSMNKPKKEAKEQRKVVVSVQDRMKAKAYSIAGEIDYLFDNVVWQDDKSNPPEFDDVYKILVERETSGPVAELSAGVLQTRLEELQDIPNDKQLQEGYSSYKKKDLKRFSAFYEMAIDACKQFNENVKRKRVRKPRKRGKVMNAERKLRTFKYLPEYKDWQLASVNPENILRASEVWLYVTKYRELRVVRAKDRGGLDIKGCTILNVDEDKSVAKRLRQNAAQEIVKEITTAGIRKANNLLKTAKGSEPTMTFRSNANTLILAVFK